MWAFKRRIRDHDAAALQDFQEDFLPLFLLFAVSVTGLMLTVSYTWMNGYGYEFLAIVHAVTVIFTLLWLPFGKFFLIFQRPAQLAVKFCRDVAADDVRSAFEDSLEPRLLEHQKDEKGTKEEKLAVLAEFRKLFTLDKVKDGNDLRFAWHPGGKLHTSINGEVQPVIESKALCWALFDVYLGKRPISDTGKRRLVERVPDLLAAAAAPADGGK